MTDLKKLKELDLERPLTYVLRKNMIGREG